MQPPYDLVIDSDTTLGEGGFIQIRRLRVRHRHPDGAHTGPYTFDFIERPVGGDAVVVIVWSRDVAGTPQLLVRHGLRPALWFGRTHLRSLMFPEVVAGVVERGDVGEAGLRARAVAEVLEEAGFVVDAAALVPLGAASFPSPGPFPEAYHYFAVEVDPATQGALAGDGSPMEEGATTAWVSLEAFLAGAWDGSYPDGKSELAARRLAAWLGR